MPRAVIRGSSGDALEIEYRVKYSKAMGRPSREQIEQALYRKARTSGGQWDGKTVAGATEGQDTPGMKIEITRYRNQDRRKGKDRGWRTGDQAALWGSLRRAIAAVRPAIALRRG